MNKTITLQVIKPNNPLHEECKVLCVLSKQLYNVGLYELRQALFNHQQFLSYQSLYQQMKDNTLDYNKIAGVDLGLNNLMTVGSSAATSNQADIRPVMVNGRPFFKCKKS